MTTPTTFTTRRPSGTASYPIVLLAGVQGGGKSWTAAASTGLPQFRRSFWLELGEQMADEYGDVPGADYEIIEHDGSYRQILAAVKWAVAESKKDGPGVFVFDSVTEFWGLLSDEAQVQANERAARKGRPVGPDGADIAMDLWNRAKDRSNDVMDALREFNGLVVMTARLDEQAVIGADGKPTGDRHWKIRTHKDTPFYAQVIMQARSPRQWTMTKVASTKLQMPDAGYLAWPEFSIEELLIRMELDGVDRDPVVRRFQRTDPAAIAEEDGGQREQSDAPTADEPRGNVPALPSDRAALDALVADLEAALDKPGLLALHARAKAHGNRIAMAKIESAGRRVTKRLEQGETPPPAATETPDPVPADDGEGMPEPTAEELAQSEREAEAAQGAAIDAAREAEEAEMAAIDAARDAEEAAASAPKAEGDAPSSADAEPESTSTTTTPESSEPSTEPSEAPSEAPGETAETAGPPESIVTEAAQTEGAQVVWDEQAEEWAIVKPDTAQARANTPRRRGVLAALSEKHGENLNNAVFDQFGLDVEYVGTSRLQQMV